MQPKTSKKCVTCKLTLDIEHFYKNRSQYDGYNGRCKSCQKKYSRKYVDTHQDKHAEWKAKWIQKRPDYWTEYSNKRLSTDPRYKLTKRLRTCVYMKLKNRGIKKDGSVFSSLDYKVDDLRKHLESRFLPGMTWENYGEWHVDHIIPDKAFNYSSMNDEEFRKCWSLENLQPLWAKDNLSKGAKF